MKNASTNEPAPAPAPTIVKCAICGKEYSGDRRNQALGIHRAKSHNKKCINSAKDLLSNFKEDRKNQQNELEKLDHLIFEIEYKMKNGN